jgi:hypothetical protein
MYRLGRRQFGLQFHVEVAERDIEAWLAADAGYVTGALGSSGAERIRTDTARYFSRFAERGDRLLAQLLSAMLA